MSKLTAEEALLNALLDLYKLMYEQEGSGRRGGMNDFLKLHDCKMITYLGPYLKEEKIIDVARDGRNRILFYNKQVPPNMGMCKQIMTAVREIKSQYGKSKTKVDDIIPKSKETVLKEPTLTREDIIKELIDEANKTMEGLLHEVSVQQALINHLNSKLNESTN